MQQKYSNKDQVIKNEQEINPKSYDNEKSKLKQLEAENNQWRQINEYIQMQQDEAEFLKKETQKKQQDVYRQDLANMIERKKKEQQKQKQLERSKLDIQENKFIEQSLNEQQKKEVMDIEMKNCLKQNNELLHQRHQVEQMQKEEEIKNVQQMIQVQNQKKQQEQYEQFNNKLHIQHELQQAYKQQEQEKIKSQQGLKEIDQQIANMELQRIDKQNEQREQQREQELEQEKLKQQTFVKIKYNDELQKQIDIKNQMSKSKEKEDKYYKNLFQQMETHNLTQDQIKQQRELQQKLLYQKQLQFQIDKIKEDKYNERFNLNPQEKQMNQSLIKNIEKLKKTQDNSQKSTSQQNLYSPLMLSPGLAGSNDHHSLKQKQYIDKALGIQSSQNNYNNNNQNLNLSNQKIPSFESPVKDRPFRSFSQQKGQHPTSFYQNNNNQLPFKISSNNLNNQKYYQNDQNLQNNNQNKRSSTLDAQKQQQQQQQLQSYLQPYQQKSYNLNNQQNNFNHINNSIMSNSNKQDYSILNQSPDKNRKNRNFTNNQENINSKEPHFLLDKFSSSNNKNNFNYNNNVNSEKQQISNISQQIQNQIQQSKSKSSRQQFHSQVKRNQTPVKSHNRFNPITQQQETVSPIKNIIQKSEEKQQYHGRRDFNKYFEQSSSKIKNPILQLPYNHLEPQTSHSQQNINLSNNKINNSALYPQQNYPQNYTFNKNNNHVRKKLDQMLYNSPNLNENTENFHGVLL